VPKKQGHRASRTIGKEVGPRPSPPMTAASPSRQPRVSIALVRALHGEVDAIISVTDRMACVSSTASKDGVRQHALRRASGCKVGVKCQFVDWGLSSARRQVELKNTMLRYARKWDWATLRVPLVISTCSRSTTKKHTLSGKRTMVFTAPSP
jgi:hypothetical protein